MNGYDSKSVAMLQCAPYLSATTTSGDIWA